MNQTSARTTRLHWPRWAPTPGNMIFTLIVALLFWQIAGAAPGAMQSQAPAAASTAGIPYQGRLANTAGAPLLGTYTMVFRLYAASSGGVPLWEEQWTGPNGVKVSDGLFNVMLGSLIPLPNNVVTGNGSLWLGITVNTDNEMAPRVQLGVVPYTIFALNIADSTVSTAKLVDGAVTSSKIMTGAVGTNALANGSVTQAKFGPDVSLVPPDGSITTAKIANGAATRQKLGSDVSLIQIQSGSVNGSTATPGWALATSTPSNHAYYVAHVTFPQSFATVPTISVAMSKLDDASETNTRIEVYAQNITATGFDMVMHKWHITLVYEVTASWIAYAPR